MREDGWQDWILRLHLTQPSLVTVDVKVAASEPRGARKFPLPTTSKTLSS